MLAIPRDIRMSATWIDHQAQRALTFQIRDAMNDFLRQLHDVDTAMPGTVQESRRVGCVASWDVVACRQRRV